MIYLNHLGMACPLGDQLPDIAQRLLFEARSGLRASEQYSPGRSLPLGLVDTVLPSIAHLPMPDRSRNNQLALAALAGIRAQVAAAIAHYGAERIGIVLGTSTSGIAESEAAVPARLAAGTWPAHYHYGQQEMGSPAQMLAHELGTSGPAYVISSACASSAKALASAARLINMGLCDVVLAGGVDSLCRFTVAGFASLESVSEVACNPLSAHRKGINIGEGAALFLVSAKANPGTGSIVLAGWGESSDGHHISAPDPSGAGAKLAITAALQRAGITAAQIDYINLHGTATPQNDAMEAGVIAGLFGAQVPVSSTKPFTGHTLGAAGAIEAGLCWLAMQETNAEGRLPPQLWDGDYDPALPPLMVVQPGDKLGRPLHYVLSNSFAFGGTNAALVLARSEHVA